MKPIRAFKRWIARNFYEGARYRLGTPWLSATFRDARMDLDKSTRVQLQSKSRHFARNSGRYNRLRETFGTYTAGTGLAVHPSSSDPRWNEACLRSWRAWEPYADLSSRQSFSVLLGQVASLWFTDGECFILLTAGESGKPRLQVIEAHRCETPEKERKREGWSVCDGVEIDPNTRRPTGYWFKSTNEKQEALYTLYTASVVVHVFEPERPEQYRGEPFVAPVLNELADLDELCKLEMKTARAAAVIANVVYNASGDVPAEDVYATGGSATQDATTGQVTALKESTGGETIFLRNTDKIEQFRSDRPTEAFRNHIKDLTDQVCYGIGIPSVVAFPDAMQGTQYRGSLDMAATWFKSRAQVLIDVVRRIYAWVVSDSANWDANFRGVERPLDWQAVTVYPPRAPNVDVGRNSSAMLAELDKGATNWAQIYGPLGLDWKEQLRAKAEQLKYIVQVASEFGVDPQMVATMAVTQAQPQQTA